MARKPNKRPQSRSSRAAPQIEAAAASAARQRPAASTQRLEKSAGLVAELAAAKGRIAQLEKCHSEVLRRLETAIEAVHKLLES